MADGWSELGAMLGGGGQLKRQAYQMGVEGGARQAGLLEQARKLRDANLAREAISPQAIANVDINPITGQANDPEAQNALRSELVSSMLRAGVDPRQLSGYQKDRQGIDFRNQAMSTATAAHPDENLLNRVLMVINGKPTNLTKVEGNMVLNPTMTPDSQTVAPSQLGLAEMVLRGAQSNAANASAGVRDTQAAAGGFNPRTGSRSSGAGKPTLPAGNVMGAILGQIVDPHSGLTTIPKASDFVAWQAQKAATDPRYANGNFALQQWALQGQPPIGADDLGITREGAPSKVAVPSRKVSRTGTAPDGRKVVQYDDGTVDYAD